MADGAPYEPRVPGAYAPHVADFDRDEKGDVILSSLKGPARIEVGGLEGARAAVRRALSGVVSRGSEGSADPSRGADHPTRKGAGGTDRLNLTETRGVLI